MIVEAFFANLSILNWTAEQIRVITACTGTAPHREGMQRESTQARRMWMSCENGVLHSFPRSPRIAGSGGLPLRR
jgi:hypothetical protein